MKELNFEQMENVQGGMQWEGRCMSTNVLDLRYGYFSAVVCANETMAYNFIYGCGFR